MRAIAKARTMNIAFVVTDLSNTRIGGISRVATEAAAALAAQGHRVVAYVLRRPGAVETCHRGIELRYIEPFATPNPDYPVVGFSRRAFAALCRDWTADGFDVVHSFNLNAIGCLSCWRELKQRRVPLVMSSYETIMMDVRAKLTEFWSLPSFKTLAQITFESLLAAFYERRYLRHAARVVTEDENTRRALIDMGIPNECIRLIPSGVDIDAAQRANAPGIDVRGPGAGPVIGYLGRVDPRKGVQYLVSAMLQVRRRHPEAVLFLAGGSRHGYDETIRALIAQHGLQKWVRVLGRISGDILPYYKLADLVVIPSLSEGIPITLGEAMAARIPVVITRLPGVVPFVQPSDLVHWADIADVDSLVGAILAALDNPGRAQQIDRAFNFIVQHSWSAVADRYLAVYRELVA